MELNRRCQCKFQYCPMGVQEDCPNDMTQEDLLCDFCRGKIIGTTDPTPISLGFDGDPNNITVMTGPGIVVQPHCHRCETLW